MKKISVKIRKSWGILNPATRKIESKRQYNRRPKNKSYSPFEDTIHYHESFCD